MTRHDTQTALEHVRDAIKKHGTCAHLELEQQRAEVREGRWLWVLSEQEQAEYLMNIETQMQAIARLLDAWM